MNFMDDCQPVVQFAEALCHSTCLILSKLLTLTLMQLKTLLEKLVVFTLDCSIITNSIFVLISE